VIDADTALITYALGREESYVWLVTRTSVFSAALPPRSTIEAAARRLHEALSARNRHDPEETPAARRARLARAEAEYAAGARFLSQVLLEPLRGRLQARRLLVVPDGALHYIPFAALPDPQARPGPDGQTPALILSHEIVSAPSASTLAVVRRESLGRRRPGKMIAVLADPVFSLEDPRLSPSVAGPSPPAATPPWRGDRRFARLPYSGAEAEAVLELAPPGQSLRALGFDASRATALDPALGDYRIVHFATHGILNSQSPQLSGLVLSLMDHSGAPQDGFLGVPDVYSLDLSAELVVLSACQTALGQEMRGEGLLGLTRAFMYAGASRVMASLWSIDDEATAELMSRFYRGMLGRGLRPAAALREAQISLSREKRWRSPYYWGSFILLGEWQ
jgi:CHAT domain-containing protein